MGIRPLLLSDFDLRQYGTHTHMHTRTPTHTHTHTHTQRMHKMVEINVQSMIHMCHLFMPKMVEKKRGIVINLSSASAIRPYGILVVYRSTKVLYIYL